MKLAPIAFFAFNRPDHTRRALESLASNKEAKDTDMFVFIDGPRNEKDIERIKQVKETFQSRQWCKSIEIFEEKK